MRAVRSERGFTLVELMVVILIVGILAAIGIGLFFNQRSKGQDTEAKEHAALVAQTLLMYAHDTETFATATRAVLIALEPAIAEAQGLVMLNGNEEFEISVESESGTSGGGPFRVEYNAGRTIRRCDGPGRGACPGTGLW
jgi:prepilin-type N-terminal cleavage/methylation domain-containing protein